MNIFSSDSSPWLSAQALDDKRVRKMLLETAQILCTVLNSRGHQTPYKNSHAGNAITLWAAADDRNLYWLLQHGVALSLEYDYRWPDRTHKSQAVIEQIIPLIKRKRRDPDHFVNRASHSKLGLDFTHLPTHQAYRQYLSARWKGDKRAPIWTKRGAPSWRSE